MNSSLITISVVTGFLSMVMIIVVLLLPQWRTNSRVASDPNMNMMNAFEGLWIRCTSYAYTYWNCDNYDSSLIGLPSYLNAFRALMIIAFITSLIGVVTSILGMRCANVMDDDSDYKRWTVIVGGICHLAAAAMTCVCVSWYAAEVIREFHNPYNQISPIRYELGACIYVGWIASLFALIPGGLMGCCTCFSKPDETGYTPKAQYRPSQPVGSYNDQPYEYKKTMTFDKAPDYYEQKSSSRRNHDRRSSSRHHRSSRRHESVSSFSSNDESHKITHGGSRHDSDLMRSSGYV